MLRRRFSIIGAVAVAIAALPVPTTAAPPVQHVTFVLKRTTTGPTSYTLDIGVDNDNTHGSFIGEVGARIVRRKVVGVTPSFAASSRRWEDSTLRVGDTRVSTCDVNICHDDKVTGYQGLGTTYVDAGEPDAPNFFFVVASGRRVAYTFRGTGWKLYRATLRYRYVDGAQNAPASAHAGAVGAEVFTESRAPGGRSGSLAVAIPPCSVAMSGLASRGAGQVTLDGGVRPARFTCPADRSFVGSYATAATTWRLHGTAAGESTGQDTRLFVLDLPTRLP